MGLRRVRQLGSSCRSVLAPMLMGSQRGRHPVALSSRHKDFPLETYWEPFGNSPFLRFSNFFA